MHFLKKNKIPCYVIVFEQVDIIKSTLNFLAEYSKELDIIVIENYSSNTKTIKPFIDELGKLGLVSRYYLFKENIVNNAMHIVLDKERELIKNSRFVMITDGDVVCDDRNWLKEEVKILTKHRDVFTCGISMDLSNLPLKTFPHANDWMPADKSEHADYYETVTGTHLELLRGQELYELLRWKDEHNIHLVDGVMHKYCEETLGKKWARTKKASARHLTWDLYQDLSHPYTQFKLSKDFNETWRTPQTSEYTLTNF